MIRRISAQELFQLEEDFSMIAFDYSNEHIIYCTGKSDQLKSFKYNSSKMRLSFSLKNLIFVNLNQEVNCIIFQERQSNKFLVFSMELQKYVDSFELMGEFQNYIQHGNLTYTITKRGLVNVYELN